MVDFKRLWQHQRGGSTPRPHHYVTPRSKSGHERYREPVVAPMQAAQRIAALEGWLEYTQR